MSISPEDELTPDPLGAPILHGCMLTLLSATGIAISELHLFATNIDPTTNLILIRLGEGFVGGLITFGGVMLASYLWSRRKGSHQD